jgi:hypothetical protein
MLNLRAFQSDNDGFGSQSLRTAGKPPVLARDEHVSRRNAKPRLGASARNHLQFSRSTIQLKASIDARN